MKKFNLLIVVILGLLLLAGEVHSLPIFQSPPPTLTITPTKNTFPPQPTVTMVRPTDTPVLAYKFYLPDMKINCLGGWWPMGEQYGP